MLRTDRVSLFASLCLCALLVALTPAWGQTQCSFDGQLDLNPLEIVSDSEPVLGNPSANVLLIEFFDPNCPHCQRLHSVMKKVVEEYGDRVRYYKHPVPVWQYSVQQIGAILLAKEKGKYYEMIDKQLESGQQGGLDIDRLVEMADEIGLSPEWMRKQLNQKGLQKRVGQTSVVARKAGVQSTPTLAIGRDIVSSSQPTSCIGELIERKLQ